MANDGGEQKVNGQITDAVNFTNTALTKDYNFKTNMPEAMLISQAKGLAKLSAAQYIDAVMKISVAENAVLMKDLAKYTSGKDAEGVVIVGLAMAINNDMMSSATNVANDVKIGE